ncbi:MAG: amidohydrolase family protein, partial [Sediminibacterium sp.]|nr:amidohydrolase family protein [Sediminibacterium sp.]
GQPELPKATEGFNFLAPPQFESKKVGPYGWNQAIHPENNAINDFKKDLKLSEQLRNQGFGVAISHFKDGIARGTGIAVSLANKKENELVLKPYIGQYFSFSKGASTQSYPSSIMGSVALLRQTLLDAAWYAKNPNEELNLSLQAMIDNKALPQIFETTDKWAAMRADRIGDEFGIQYIIKANCDAYQRINEIANTKATFILDLNFPILIDVENPIDANNVSLAQLMHWELAPQNLAQFEKNNIPFCLTAAELSDLNSFLKNLRLAVKNGLSETQALKALTIFPATLFGIADQVGTLESGKRANFFITNKPIFDEKSTMVSHWIDGEKYETTPPPPQNAFGRFSINVQQGSSTIFWGNLHLKDNNSGVIYKNNDTIDCKYTLKDKSISLQLSINKKENKKEKEVYSFGGIINDKQINAWGTSADGQPLTLVGTLLATDPEKTDSAKNVTSNVNTKNLSSVVYPFNGYGNSTLPQMQTTLFKNATVWTNETEGILNETDVLVQNGKIISIGKNINPPANCKVIDATGKHLTAGIIDEHSHIAAFSINEGAQSITSEVRIQDNLYPDDINIYRQLSGGVTSSHILHGSANTIGGQTQLIKLRWGVNDQQLMFEGWSPFIKFALGENVKRTAALVNNRYPNTRMGVEQILDNAFAQAKQYQIAMQSNPNTTRRNLELDALVEILEKKRFITCHSYVESEIISAMRVGEKYGFIFNTFTHILEGYKVADLMKKHGANVSTFSDWYGYKMEVHDAIAYNASLMKQVGLNVCINSDDAEMARRLNQEAAKVMRYGGCSEEDAFKMVTLNPAIALHIEDRVGSIKVKKDADLVLWSHNPLSIYAKAEITMIEGAVYFNRQEDQEKQKQLNLLKQQLIQKALREKKKGSPAKPPLMSKGGFEHKCSDHQDIDDEIEQIYY